MFFLPIASDYPDLAYLGNSAKIYIALNFGRSALTLFRIDVGKKRFAKSIMLSMLIVMSIVNYF